MYNYCADAEVTEGDADKTGRSSCLIAEVYQIDLHDVPSPHQQRLGSISPNLSPCRTVVDGPGLGIMYVSMCSDMLTWRD